MVNVFLRSFYLLIVITSVLSNNTSDRTEYTASIVGLENIPMIEASAQKLSQLINPDSDFSPESEGVLRDFLQEDISRIQDYLHSYGFYDAKLFPEIEETAEQNYKITIHVYPGERYTVNRITILVNDVNYSLDPDILSIKKDSPVVNELILKDKNTIALFLKRNGHAFVETLDELVVINHDTLLANITYSFKTGPSGAFGSYMIVGLRSVKQSYIEKFIRWKLGDPYNIDRITETEGLLMDTGLFESVLITPEPHNTNKFAININLTEAKPNHLRFNIYGNVSLLNDVSNRYEIGCMPRYIHDNIAGANEKFEINSVLSNTVQDINVYLKKPQLIFFDTTARMFFSGEHRTYDAYSRLGLDGGLGIDYKLIKHTYIDISTHYERYSLTQKTQPREDKYNFFGFPITLRIDTREDKIFSRSGFQLNTVWTPYIGSHSLRQLLVTGSFYMPIRNESFILAGWGYWHRVSGVAFEDTPMDKRVYLGGSQNLRGYSKDGLGNYRQLTNRQDKSVPIGGLSAIAFGIEPRFKLYQQLWAAAFFDAGYISEQENVLDNIHNITDLYLDVGEVFSILQTLVHCGST